MNFDELTAIIEQHNSFLITTHENPDGDGLGSMIAFKRHLESRNKKVGIVISDPVPPELEFIDPEKVINTINDKRPDTTFDICFALDTAVFSRIKKIKPLIEKQHLALYTIDHHIPEAGSFAGVIMQEASSTGEILYRFFNHNNVTITPDLAAPIFYAVAYDTGWMRFSNTSPEILRIMADLSERADIALFDGYDILRNNWSSEKFKLYTEVMNTLEIKEQFIAIIHCTQAMFNKYIFKSGISPATDMFINDLFRLKGCTVFIFLKEKPDRKGYRVSLRSRRSINVRTIAARFGGGGHAVASGCMINNFSLKETRKKIINEVLKTRNNPDSI